MHPNCTSCSLECKNLQIVCEGTGAWGDCSKVEEFYYLLGIFAVKKVLQRFNFLELENYWSRELFNEMEGNRRF